MPQLSEKKQQQKKKLKSACFQIHIYFEAKFN